MKILNPFFISSMVVFVGCSQQNKNTETNKAGTEVTQKP
jgi:hypothetical protein